MGNKHPNYHAQEKAEAWEHLLGYAVEDASGTRIGTLKALWEDFTRRPAYLGVATGWLAFGNIHIVPAQYAGVSERLRRIRLPFSAETVRRAPECSAKSEITLKGETKIRDYYRGKLRASMTDGDIAARVAPDGIGDWRRGVSPAEDLNPVERTETDDESPRTGLRKFEHDTRPRQGETEPELGLPDRDPHAAPEEGFVPMPDLDPDFGKTRRPRGPDPDRPLH